MRLCAFFSAVLFCLFLAAARDTTLASGQNSGQDVAPMHTPFSIERATDPHWEALIAHLAADGLERERLEQLFSDLGLPWSPGFMAVALQELYGPRLGADAQLKAMPENEARPPPGYLPPAENGYGGAQNLLKEQSALLAEAQIRYGVPPSLITAVLLLESDMGHELGNRQAFYVLACIAGVRVLDDALAGFEKCRTTPALKKEMQKSVKEKSAWAYKELLALIRYGETSGVDILRLPGSAYGAIGLCQFTPSSIEAYGVDSTGKGVVDLFSLPDAVHSVGNFLKAHAFSQKESIKKQLEVLRRYNQSDSYAVLVLGVSLQLAGKPVPSELSVFSAEGRRHKAWWPKSRPGYKLPPLKAYVFQPLAPSAAMPSNARQ